MTVADRIVRQNQKNCLQKWHTTLNKKQKIKMVRCGVENCPNNSHNNKDASFFSLPKHHETLLKWLEFVSNVRLDNFAKFRICNLHFEDTCFRKKYPRPLLLMGSIPTLKSFTGHANEKINKSKPTNESSTSSPTDAVDSTSSPTDAVDSTSSPTDAVDSISSPTDAVDSTSSPTDAVDSTLSPTDAADTISSIDMNQVITDSIEKSESLYDHEDNSEESKRARFQIDIDVPSTCKVVVYGI
ncbi:THAP domain-containing protein 11-like isoform X2 [Solenopsis invicta]|uniref:THAP domain-containing protein 11-like isoform X2 n=1 Tax=Solenopsis invicta TaxID=13686 RepID=UPI00193CD49A|nr:THAP domain-containing protein 11-like isoform X2 [Solenopsis invicta]